MADALTLSTTPAETVLVHQDRYVPLIGDARLRGALGLAIVTGSAAAVASARNAGGVAVLLIAAWAVAVAITDKYVHKYPYRYYPYLAASHTKATAVMAVILGGAVWLLSPYRAAAPLIWQAFGWFTAVDFLLGIPRRHVPLKDPFDRTLLTSREVNAQASAISHGSVVSAARTPLVDGLTASMYLAALTEGAATGHISRRVPGLVDGTTVSVVDEVTVGVGPDAPAEVLFVAARLNDIRHLNRFLIAAGERLRMGGTLVCQYQRLEERRSAIQARYGGLFWPAFLIDFAFHRIFPKIPVLNRLYFVLTRGRNRALSKAEVWGRLSFCGLKVTEEVAGAGTRVFMAQRIAMPITGRKPSYYPVVALSKVGLDGQMLRTHKVRSMYAFSEFLQKQIFDDNGLTTTGKFRNDFRLTEYGKYLRRYWIDELPQLYDWLRGDIKLVGMRATSPHFLSLYTSEFIDLYVRVKPGLIPPLPSDACPSFEQFMQYEFSYLKRYIHAPVRTDAGLLWNTLTDILHQGVRGS